MSTDPNSFEAIKPKLSQKTLEDIEGIDPAEYGFGRKECCGAIPKALAGSMRLNEHVFLASTVPATEWAKKTENVPHYNQLSKLVKEKSPATTFTVCEAAGEDEYLLRFALDVNAGNVHIHQCSLPADESHTDLPWGAKGVLTTDRSDEYFIFVCAHRSRDERCGYCGAILVDLFRQSIAQHLDEERARKVSVYPCSHVGGHVYAGNVILYSSRGGVCFGLFKPEDVDKVVESIAEDKGTIPISLQGRIRGKMDNFNRQQEEQGCSVI